MSDRQTAEELARLVAQLRAENENLNRAVDGANEVIEGLREVVTSLHAVVGELRDHAAAKREARDRAAAEREARDHAAAEREARRGDRPGRSESDEVTVTWYAYRGHSFEVTSDVHVQ